MRECITDKLYYLISAILPSTETTQGNVQENKANVNRLLPGYFLSSSQYRKLPFRATEPWVFHFFENSCKFRAICIQFDSHYSVYLFYYLSQINFAGKFNNMERLCQRWQLCSSCPESQPEIHNT